MEPSFEIIGGTTIRPSVSILTSCYKYKQRLTVYLDSIARQGKGNEAIEIVIADPESPDGLAEYLRGFAKQFPFVRVIRAACSNQFRHNRGACINRAFEASSAEIILSTDGDIVFQDGMIHALVDAVRKYPNHVFGIRRHFLDKDVTNMILNGSLNPHSEFEKLLCLPSDAEPNGKEGVLGYCQTLTRSAFRKAGYPAEFNMINQSDIVFLERLQKHASVTPVLLDELTVLHLWHPRNWLGTEELL